MDVAKDLPIRSDVPSPLTWDNESVFPSDEAWAQAYAQVQARIPAAVAYRGRLSEGAGLLADALAESEGLLRCLGHLVIYASNAHNVDTADSSAAAMDDRASGLAARVAAALSFLEPEIIALGFGRLRRWSSEEPRLTAYAHYFDTLERRQAHVRSPEVEELLGAVRDPFHRASATHGVLADADLIFAPARSPDRADEPLQVAQGTIDALLIARDPDIRRSAWESYADAHLRVANTMASCLAAGVKQNVFIARARHYGSALEASLDNNNIPTPVYHNVVDTFVAHLPTWHRYWSIRRRALGLDRLPVYDVKAPLQDGNPRVPLEEAVAAVCEGVRPLGEEYVSVMRIGLTEQRWVDLAPNRGKRAGAYSYGHPGTHPFILMSYTDDLESVSTLAHELGHSMHSYYTWRAQPYVYTDYSIFVAEVPSNLNQALVRRHLLDSHTDPEFQVAVIEEAMSNLHRYLFLMPTLARFELEVHRREERGEALTAQSMSALMLDLFREAYGAEVEVDDERVGITWAQFPTHLYANFYVYQYTIGIAGAQALVRPILAGDTEALERYLRFLATGSSLYPLEALRRAGVDMLTPEPIARAYEYLAELIDRLESLVLPASSGA